MLFSTATDIVHENKTEATIKNHPKWGLICNWAQKADDTFLEWIHSLEYVNTFQKFLNSIHMHDKTKGLK